MVANRCSLIAFFIGCLWTCSLASSPVAGQNVKKPAVVSKASGSKVHSGHRHRQLGSDPPGNRGGPRVEAGQRGHQSPSTPPSRPSPSHSIPMPRQAPQHPMSHPISPPSKPFSNQAPSSGSFPGRFQGQRRGQTGVPSQGLPRQQSPGWITRTPHGANQYPSRKPPVGSTWNRSQNSGLANEYNRRIRNGARAQVQRFWGSDKWPKWRYGYRRHRGWPRANFFYGFYLFSPFDVECVISPWYFYPAPLSTL